MTANHDRDELEDIKAALTDPWDVVCALGLDAGAQRQANGFMVCCPAHDDTTPSCSVTIGPDGTLRAKCFGCHLAGDVFTLIAAAEGSELPRDFNVVKRRAAELAGIELKQYGSSCHRDNAAPSAAFQGLGGRERSSKEVSLGALPAIPDEAFNAICGTLHANWHFEAETPVSRDVRNYLLGRDLLGAAINDGWFALPTPAEQPACVNWLRRAGEATPAGSGLGFTTAQLDTSGLIYHDGFAHPDHRLAIPWRDRAGRVITLQRRLLADGAHKYVFPLHRPSHWPYGIDRLRDDGAPILLVEGATDVLALRQILAHRGEQGCVLGLPGVSGWRREWVQFVRGRVVVLAFDADEPGDRLSSRLAADLPYADVARIERWRPQPYKDWGELWVAGRGTP